MTPSIATIPAPRSGDIVEIHEHRLGETRRSGEILEVLGEPGHQHFRVRWDDGRESLFYPSSDATTHRATRPRRRKGVRAPRQSGGCPDDRARKRIRE